MPIAVVLAVAVSAAQLKPWPKHPIPAGIVQSVDGSAIRIPGENAKATVIFFLTVDCPIGNRYAPEIRSIVAKFGKDVSFVADYTDPAVDLPAIRKHRADFQLAFPAFVDRKHEWVDKIGAAVTPEAALISPSGKVLYRGRIDDLYLSPGSRKPHADRHDLRIAITEALAGKSVSEPMMIPIGCAISPVH